MAEPETVLGSSVGRAMARASCASGLRSIFTTSALVLVVACQPPPDAPRAAEVETDPGAPLPGLSVEQLDRFRAGQTLFARVFTPEEGAGPLLNETACNACHTDPADGGVGDRLSAWV